MIPQVTQWGVNSLLGGADPIIVWIDGNGNRWPLSGGLAPIPPLEGVALSSLEGLMAALKLLTQQGAQQDGATYMGHVYEAGAPVLDLEVFANTPRSYRNIVRQLIAGFDPDNPGRLSWFTPEIGEWWYPARFGKEIDATFKTSPARVGHASFQVSLHVDQAFCQSFDSVSAPVGQSGGFATMTNLGTEKGWARYLFYGPGTVTFADPAGPVTFGPLEAGQVVLLTTQPGLRGVLDLTPNQSTPTQQQFWSGWLSNILNLAQNNNTPPLLSAFESALGIVPPQGSVYSLLSGRFQTPVPAIVEGTKPSTFVMPIKVTGGSPATRIIGAVTPYRKWPE